MDEQLHISDLHHGLVHAMDTICRLFQIAPYGEQFMVTGSMHSSRSFFHTNASLLLVLWRKLPELHDVQINSIWNDLNWPRSSCVMCILASRVS